MTSNTELRGVGGWLLLLVIGLTILGPLVAFGQNASEFALAEHNNPELASYAPWGQFKSFSYLALILGLSVTFSAGILLATSRTPGAVRFTIAAMWLSAPVYVALQAMATSASLGSAAIGEIAGEFVITILKSSITATVWTLYLLKSKRVKNTYYAVT